MRSALALMAIGINPAVAGYHPGTTEKRTTACEYIRIIIKDNSILLNTGGVRRQVIFPSLPSR